MIIKTDTPAVKNALQELHDILVKHGSAFHPDLALCFENGNFFTEMTSPCPSGHDIINIPHELLLPTDELHFSFKEDALTISPDMDKVTKEHVEIAKAFIKGLNAADKVKQYKEHCLWLKAKATPEIMAPFIEMRTPHPLLQERINYIQDLDGAKSDEDFACWSFMNTRILGQRDGEQNTLKNRCLPIGDLANHHAHSIKFIFKKNQDGTNIFAILNHQPKIASSECFVSYGVYDAMDMLFTYDYVDEDTPFVRSMPINITLDDLGTINILAYPNIPLDENIPEHLKDLQTFMPHISSGENIVEFTHLMIPTGFAPDSMRRILHEGVKAFINGRKDDAYIIQLTYQLEKAIIDTNIKHYKDALIHFEKTDADEKLKQCLTHLAEVQLNKLYKYEYNPSFFESNQAPQSLEAVNA